MNNCNAQYAVDEDGCRWIKKAELGRDGVMAEALGWLLCKKLGASALDAACVFDAGESRWLSRQLEHVSHWREASGPMIANIDELAAGLVVDVVLRNPDRHEGNILLRHDDPASPRAYVIDYAASLAGEPKALANCGIEPPSVASLVRGLPVDRLTDPAMGAAYAALEIDGALVREFVDEACSLASSGEETLLFNALLRRLRAAPDMVATYLSDIKGRQ